MMLEVSDVDVFYADFQALHGVSLAVQEGEIVALLGANGAGKTTVLRAVSGLRPARRGGIRFQGKPLAGRPASARAALGIGMVPEGRELWPQLSVLENLELGAYGRSARHRRAANLERVYALFPRLFERRLQHAGSLSGGEQQMCAIARALMGEPKLLMLDEPSLGLAPLLVRQVFDTVRKLHRDGMTILLVEQNLKQALELASRGYILETGAVKLQGPSAQLLADDGLRAAYLGV